MLVAPTKKSTLAASIDYSSCSFHGEFDITCGSRSQGRFSEVCALTKLLDLHMDITDELGMNTDQKWSELQLICNRAGLPLDKVNSDTLICPRHRYQLGVKYVAPKKCLHPQHSQIKRKQVLTRVSFTVYLFLKEKFKNCHLPLGMSICKSCLNDAYAAMKNTGMEEIVEEAAQEDSDHDMYHPPVIPPSPKKRHVAEDFNEALEKMDVSPIRGILQYSFDSVSDRHQRRVRQKFKTFIVNMTDKFANASTTMPIDNFREKIAQPVFRSLVESMPSSRPTDAAATTEFDNLVRIFQGADKKCRIQILTIVAGDYSAPYLVKQFGCTEHEIKTARALIQEAKEFQQPERKCTPAPRISAAKVQHFLDFLLDNKWLEDNANYTCKITLDNGKTNEIPQVLLVVKRRQMVQHYLKFCRDSSYNGIGERRCFDVLQELQGMQKTALRGVDNFIADGKEAFDTVLSFCKSSIQEEVLDLPPLIEAAQQHLSVTYILHISSQSDEAYHCPIFSLSDPADADFAGRCSHDDHKNSCSECKMPETFFSVLKTFSTASEKGVMERLENQVMAWRSHVMRGVQQNLAKSHSLTALLTDDDDAMVIISDWSMKWLPSLHMEKQSDWFGKRGISLHVDVVLTKPKNTTSIEAFSYVTAINDTPQNGTAVLCCFENLLTDLVKSFEGKNKICLRSDNAGCYHSESVILAKREIAQKFGLQVTAYHFCEPQRGKDQADRVSAIVKSRLRSAVDAGANATTAEEIHENLLSNGGLRNVKVAVLEIEDNCTIDCNKTHKNFGAIHSIVFEHNAYRCWRYYEVGAGKVWEYPEVSVSLKYRATKEFANDFPRGIGHAKKHSTLRDVSMPLKLCPEVECTETFTSEEDLESHLKSGEHTTSSLSWCDIVRTTIIRQSIVGRKPSITTPHKATLPAENEEAHSLERQGWALPPKRQAKRFSDAQLEFIRNLFDEGANTGKKYTADKAAALMRKNFPVDQQLSKGQITSLFSRFASTNAKNQQVVQPVSDDDTSADDAEIEKVIFRYGLTTISNNISMLLLLLFQKCRELSSIVSRKIQEVEEDSGPNIRADTHFEKGHFVSAVYNNEWFIGESLAYRDGN
jgi:hypothetical protein